MTDRAPERIWAVADEDVSAQTCEIYAQDNPDGFVDKPTKYIRADLAHPTPVGDVERFVATDLHPPMQPDPIGAWVHYNDYAAQAARIAELEGALGFYAERDNYRNPSVAEARERLNGADPIIARRGGGIVLNALHGCALSPIQEDEYGKTARAALQNT